MRFIQDFRDQPFINGIIKTGPSGPGIIITEGTPGTQIESWGTQIESGGVAIESGGVQIESVSVQIESVSWETYSPLNPESNTS